MKNIMRTNLLPLTLAGLMLTTTPAFSAGAQADGLKHDGSVIGGIAIGVAAGGPVGAVVGALAGSWVGKKVERTDVLQEELADARDTSEELRVQLAELQTDLFEYRTLAAQSLELEILFYTDKSDLNPRAKARLAQVAAFINKREDLTVHLSGYADPRGSDHHNLALSESRVATVAAILRQHGIAPERIHSSAYGAGQSEATNGDIDAYAFERRVSIELTAEPEATELASN